MEITLSKKFEDSHARAARFRLQARQKISDAAWSISEESFFNLSLTLIHFTAPARRGAEEASQSVQEASRTSNEAC